MGPFGIDGVKPNCWNCCWSGSMFRRHVEGHGLLTRRCWKTRNPVAAGDAANPYLFSDLNRYRPEDDEVVGGVADDLLGRE